ncbi:hypothetical protein Bbelb_294140 [Branchiostoma belcheri]|nr:hypothetical protein Bbelb_294140 [Branchiostoma belcheri]
MSGLELGATGSDSRTLPLRHTTPRGYVPKRPVAVTAPAIGGRSQRNAKASRDFFGCFWRATASESDRESKTCANTSKLCATRRGYVNHVKWVARYETISVDPSSGFTQQSWRKVNPGETRATSLARYSTPRRSYSKPLEYILPCWKAGGLWLWDATRSRPDMGAHLWGHSV